MNFPPYSLPDLAPADVPQHAGYHHPLTQRVNGLDGVDGVFSFTQQAQLPGERFTPTQNNYGPHLFGLSSVPTSHAQYDAEFAGNGPSESSFAVSAAPTARAEPTEPTEPPLMGPPARPRKRKAATLRADDWEPYKQRILDLHVGQNLSLPKVRQIMEEEHGFKAELRQYRTRISQWGKDKNVKPQEMKAIVRKRQKRKLVEPDMRPLAFKVRGNQVEPQKIERWMRRHDVAESLLYAPSPAASTPSAVECNTISELGSPAEISVYSPANISVYSPAASVPSPGGIYLAAQSPQMPSPALSVSSIVRPQMSAFAGQSPALAHRSLVELQPGFNPNPSAFAGQSPALVHRSLVELQPRFNPNPSAFESGMDVNARSRYNQDEEERLRDQILSAETSSVSSTREISSMLYELGIVLIEQGRYRAAEDVIRRLVESYAGQSGDDHDDIEMLKPLDLLGRVLCCQGLYVKAERLHRRALRGFKVLGAEHPDTLACMANLALTCGYQGRRKEAEELEVQVLETKKEGVWGGTSRDTNQHGQPSVDVRGSRPVEGGRGATG